MKKKETEEIILKPIKLKEVKITIKGTTEEDAYEEGKSAWPLPHNLKMQKYTFFLN